MPHDRKKFICCCEPGCLAKRFCFGRCEAHFRTMDPDLTARLRSMSKAERRAEFNSTQIHPPIAMPKWEYEGDQDALAAMFDKQEKETPEEN